MTAKNEEIEELLKSITDFRKTIKLCSFCFKPFEPSTEISTGKGEGKICEICSNPSRDKNQLAVVEKETDLFSLEKTRKYKGLYFILGGTVSHLKEEEIKKLRTNELLNRVQNPQKFGVKADFKEIILAINPTTEGEATTLYLERKLKPLGKKISRLGRGLPTGAELEYADEETLRSALESRKSSL
jgi:recombination protein RecR